VVIQIDRHENIFGFAFADLTVVTSSAYPSFFAPNDTARLGSAFLDLLRPGAWLAWTA
jgi:hypothetical protein